MLEKNDIKSDVQKHSHYFFTACFVFLILVSLYLIRSFIIPLLSAFILAYIFYPLYVKIKGLVRFENLAATITLLLILFIILVPLIFASNALISESVLFFRDVKNIDLTQFEKKVSAFTHSDLQFDESLKDLLNKFSLSVARGTSDFLISLPRRILSFFVTFFTIFYLFKQGRTFVEKIKEHVPLKESHKKDLILKFDSVIYASLYGLVLTAIIQGATGAIGLWIFGVESPVLWGIVMIILAMFPFVGPMFVWLPAALFKIFVGDYFNGFGLLLFGLFIVSTIDNIVRPKIVGAKGKIHPVTVVLGVFGGIELFGLLGIIIGPLVLSLSLVFLDLYLVEARNSFVKV